MRIASEKVSAPAGTTMNSCTSSRLSACAPPLITFMSGTGSVRASSPPSRRYNGTPASAAAARATASEHPRIAFAPSRLLFGDPSSSTRSVSIARWSSASRPARAAAISPFTFATAVSTPLPRYALGSPSRSSTASCSPVDAPDGTSARPSAPESSTTSTSTVGFPRESKSWRAWTRPIALIVEALPWRARSTRPGRRARARSSRHPPRPQAQRPARRAP